MTLLGTLGHASTGATAAIARAARSTFDGTGNQGNTLGRMIMSVPKSVIGGIKEALDPVDLLKASVADSPIGRKIVEKIFDKTSTATYDHESTYNTETHNNHTDEMSGDVLDKLTQIDDDIIALRDVLVGTGKSIERIIYQTTEAQTIVLTKGQGYNVVNNRSNTVFNPLALPSPVTRIVPALSDIITNSTSGDVIDNNSVSTRIAPATYQNAVTDIMAREEDREDDSVAKQQADDIHAIREHLEKTKVVANGKDTHSEKNEKSIVEKLTEKLLGGDVDIDIRRKGKAARRLPRPAGKGIAARASGMIRAAPTALGNAVASAGSSIASGAKTVANTARPIATSAATAGRGLLSSLGSLGTGTLAAGTAALLFGGTGLYSAYKAAKGEDASNWISNIVDKGVQYISGDENTSLGSKLFDIVHGDNTSTETNSIVKSNASNNQVNNNKDTIIKNIATSEVSTPKASNATLLHTSTVNNTTRDSTIHQSPEIATDAKRLEVNKFESEKTQMQPVVINNPAPVQQSNNMAAGRGGGQSVAPLVTRQNNSALAEVSKTMIGRSL